MKDFDTRKKKSNQYRKQNENGTAPWQQLNNIDEILWDGRYDIRVENYDTSMNLPFTLNENETATLIVEDQSHKGKLQHSRVIVQTISKTKQDSGKFITYSRTHRKIDGKAQWEEWKGESNENKIIWNENSHINTYTTAGIFDITGQRTNAADGLPIANASPGHTIHARLAVLDSSIPGNGQADDKCITQMLMLSNRTGGDGDVYVRTGRAANKNQLAGGNGWEPWGKLQVNMGVGQVTSLDKFTDNGVYNGVYTSGTTLFETFVMIVINNYAIAGATGKARSVSQFKYALNTDGTYSYKTRTGQGNTGIAWGEWVDMGAATTSDIQDNSITVQKLSNDVREKVENPLRPLYIAAGAEYNDSGADKSKTAPWGETVTHKAGHYYLNGLGDITEEQMTAIYAANHYVLTENISNIFFQSKIRTNICKKGTGWNNGIVKTSAKLAFYNSLIEVALVANPSWPSDTVYCFQAGDVATMFDFCNNLKRIVGVVNVQSATNVNSMLSRCPQLLSVKVIGLCSNLIIKDSPNIEVGSIVYMIQNANPVSAITITLHPDAYARLADDAEIVAALEAQPLVSLVSA